MKNCLVCDAEFEAKGRGSNKKNTCNEECKRIQINRRQNKRRAEIASKRPKKYGKCVECKETMVIPHNVTTKNFCSSKCKSRNRRLKTQYNEKTCICCKKVFNAYPNKVKFCSIECGRKQKRLNWEKKNPLLARPCEYCKEDFTPKQRDGRFCSKRCTHNAWRSIPMNNLRQNISRQINHALRKRGMVKPRITFEMLPYTPQELFVDIDSKLKDGMTWDNRSEWHIDHIRPVSSFNFTTTECEDFKKCWALENLQPLWAADNISKGNKWDGEVNA